LYFKVVDKKRHPSGILFLYIAAHAVQSYCAAANVLTGKMVKYLSGIVLLTGKLFRQVLAGKKYRSSHQRIIPIFITKNNEPVHFIISPYGLTCTALFWLDA
jgi:hypothetical protein